MRVSSANCYNTMQNSEENQSLTLSSFGREESNKCFKAIYSICSKTHLRTEVTCGLILINSILSLLIYLMLEEINLFDPFLRIDNQLIGLCLLSVLFAILIQLGIAILYQHQIFLKGQFLIYRHVILPIGIYCYVNCQVQTTNLEIASKIMVIFALASVILLQIFIGKESYANKLLVERGLPVSCHLLFFDASLLLYSSSSIKYQRLSLILMIMSSVYTKFYILDFPWHRFKSIQFTLFRIQGCFNLLYVAFIVANQLCEFNQSQKQPFVYIFPLLFFCVAAEFLGEYAAHLRPIDARFFTTSQNIEEFLEIVQYVVNDIDRINTNESEEITDTCLIPIYYMHIKDCKVKSCTLTHQLEPHLLNSNHQCKALSSPVFHVIEQLFHNLLEIHYENIQLRIAMLNFYARVGPSKVKILQMVAETENLTLSWSQRMKIYFIKKFISNIDSGEFLENRRIEDSYHNFNHSLTALMRHLVEFWAQFLEERVDFQKILKLAQKITPAMRSIQLQVDQTLELETFSTIRIMKIYSEYSRWILNDEMRSAMASDYIGLLSKKMSEVHEINYITADMEIGLVAISLNVKRLGEISVANFQAANIFNYSKEEFVKINVNQIMPSMFGQHHNDFLKAFVGNQNKKVNTDRRLLVGKKKEKYLFEIFLKLQKSAIATSEEVIFIANIEMSKMQEAIVLITCDERGTIQEINSTYYEIFEKSYRKHRSSAEKGARHFTNIQELISSFFEIVLDDSYEVKESIQCFDNPVFGIIEIKFEITKVNLPQFTDLGYIVKGRRVYEPKQPFLENISLTSSLNELSEDRELKGMKVKYSSTSNQYHFHENLDLFSCGEFHSEHTIPYVKLQFFNEIFNQKYQSKGTIQFDTDIKTLRYFGDHFERVEEAESFYSEISEEERATISNGNFSLIKENLKTSEKSIIRKTPQIFNILYVLTTVALLFMFYATVSAQRQQDQQKVFQMAKAYKFRAKLSQYIFYFEAQDDATYGKFFRQHKQTLRSELIYQIVNANLPETQKENALKVVYLEEQLKSNEFKDLVNDDTLLLNNSFFIESNKPFLLSFKIIIGFFLCFKFLISFVVMQWHQKKILGLLSLFLALPESEIKKSHEKCAQFLKEDEEKQQQAYLQERTEESEQENSHVKRKRFKNISLGQSPMSFLRLNSFTLIFLGLFSAMLINDWKNSYQHTMDKNVYAFMSTVMPEYSIKLMKTYSEIKQDKVLAITDSFESKYQSIDYELAQLLTLEDIEISSTFEIVLLGDRCQNQSYDLPTVVKCAQICNSVMTDGVSKAINFLAHRLENSLKLSKQQALSEISQLAILLYYLIQPGVSSILNEIEEEVETENNTGKILFLLYFVLILIVTVSDTIYQVSFPLASIEKNIQDSSTLIKMIPEAKKKTKGSYTQI